MPDNTAKPRSRWFQFAIRDLFWAALVTALALGWYADSKRSQREIQRLRMERTLNWIDDPRMPVDAR